MEGVIFDIQRYSISDGPGIRTTVFFKGCPLKCIWCANPESHNSHPQLFYFDSLCVRCYRCIEVCSTGASTITANGSIHVNRKVCKACGQCTKVCHTEARTISGKTMNIEEVLEIVKKDSLFYRNSGGGITASGGEPTYQPDFLQEFFKRCQENWFHTCLDTCGYVQWDVFESILEYTDLVLFDIKHMDQVKHRELTGVNSDLILKNATKIVQKGKPIIMRLPLIPGYNNSKENVKAVGEFMNQLGLRRVDILPYHQLGKRKYESLGKKYILRDVKSYKEEQVDLIIRELESYDLDVSIG